MTSSSSSSSATTTVPSILYHYTTSAGAKGIRLAGHIKKSGTSGAFGPGVYMTSMDPYSYYRNEIVQNNYGSGSRTNYADWVVFIYTDKLVKTKLHRVTTRANQDIYRYEDDVSVSPSDIHDKPQRQKKSKSQSTVTYSGVQPVTNMETVPKTLYHYVCTADAQAIKNNKKILPGRITGQAANGVLLSSMEPGQFNRDDIKQDIFDGKCPINCVDNVVQVASGQLDSSQLHQFTRQGKYDLYYYDTTITVQQPDVMDKPRCMKPRPGSQQQQQHPPYQMYGQQQQLPYMPYYPPPPPTAIQFIGGQPYVPMMPYGNNYPPPFQYGQPPPPPPSYTNQSPNMPPPPQPPPNMAYPQQNMYNPYNNNNNNNNNPYQQYPNTYYPN
ncbi:protein shank-like [Oppia nitens]|uniref:protein shank-like n=1 Tax=Oppia nitens TaxID=1686743 RepID=UPI0023DC2771|nr:protein shank-like [Oppia nitens]